MENRTRRNLLIAAGALLGTGAFAGVATTGAAGVSAMGAAPSGKRLERIQASPNFHNGAFQNLEPVVDPIDKGNRAGKMLGFLFEDQTGQKPTSPIPSIKTDLSTLPDGSMVWFGHSGFFFKMDGLSIAVDPSLHACFPVGNFFAPFPGADIYQPRDIPHLDVLILTHDHYDHLDMITVKDIESRTDRVICPLGVGAHLEYWGWPEEKITELDWTESTAVGAHGKLTCLPSQHFSGRTFTRNQTLWCAYMLELAGSTIYLSGDGGYGRHFAQIGQMWPHIDLAIVEDGQYNVDWAGIHLLPEYWKKAVFDLGVKEVMGCHNSKYDLSRHSWIDPLMNAQMNARALGVNLVSPKIGQAVRLDRLADAHAPWWPTTV